VPSVRVRDELRPGRDGSEDDLVLPDVPDRITVRELIRTRVREEVARANADRSRPRRLLVAPVDAEETLNGYRLQKGRTIDWQTQADVAEEAFAKQAFFLFVDGRQVESLDEEVALGADSEIRFLRLTALVGG
jgi:hypothetical protein